MSINITSSLLILTLTCVQVIRTSAINEYFTQSLSVCNFTDVCVNPHQIASVAVISPKLRGKTSLRSSWLHFLVCQHNCEWYLEIKTLHWRHVVRDDWPCYSLVNKKCNNFCAKRLEEENDVSIYVCIWDQTQSKNMWFVTIHQVIFFFFFFRTFQLDLCVCRLEFPQNSVPSSGNIVLQTPLTRNHGSSRSWLNSNPRITTSLGLISVS